METFGVRFGTGCLREDRAVGVRGESARGAPGRRGGACIYEWGSVLALLADPVLPWGPGPSLTPRPYLLLPHPSLRSPSLTRYAFSQAKAPTWSDLPLCPVIYCPP